MSTQPHWSPVDDDTAARLELVADVDHPSVDFEWEEFRRALFHAAQRGGGEVHPNALRPLVRGVVAPKRIGAFVNRAIAQGVLVPSGWQISDDTEGGNSGKPARVYRFVGGAAS